MKFSGRHLLVLAGFLAMLAPVSAQSPIPLLEEGGVFSPSFSITFADQDHYKRNEYWRSRDRESGRAFVWSPGIEISSDSESVRLYLNGERSGLLPWQKNHLRPGLYRFRLEKEGFESLDFMIFLEPEKRVTLNVTMSPLDVLKEPVDVSEQQPEPEDAAATPPIPSVKIPCRFSALPGSLLAPLVPKARLPILAVSLNTGVAAALEGDHAPVRIPVGLEVGSGVLGSWYIGLGLQAVIGPDLERNALHCSLAALGRISPEGASLQYGVTFRLNYDPLLKDASRIDLLLDEGSLTGVFAGFVVTGYWGNLVLTLSPELGLVPVAAEQNEEQLFGGVTPTALLRSGIALHFDRFTGSLTGMAGWRYREAVGSDSFFWAAAAEVDFLLPGEHVSLGVRFLLSSPGDVLRMAPAGFLQFQI